MSINSYLDNTASNLIIKDDVKESISYSLEVFIDRMKDYFSNNESIDLLDIKVFGSYARNTNLPPHVDRNSDVDIMLVMTDDGSQPQTYLDRVRRAAEAKYSTSYIKQSSPTVVLQMQHIKFEITPAIKNGALHYIKKSNDEWMITYCSTDLSNISEANKTNNNMIKPVIRLVKYWNVMNNYKGFHSYEIEKKIVNHYLIKQYQGYDTKQYLLTSFKLLRSLSMSSYQSERLEKAIDYLEEAINDEVDYPNIALEEIKRVIKEL